MPSAGRAGADRLRDPARTSPHGGRRLARFTGSTEVLDEPPVIDSAEPGEPEIATAELEWADGVATSSETMENAVQQAESYLGSSAFARKGLIEQLPHGSVGQACHAGLGCPSRATPRATPELPVVGVLPKRHRHVGQKYREASQGSTDRLHGGATSTSRSAKTKN